MHKLYFINADKIRFLGVFFNKIVPFLCDGYIVYNKKSITIKIGNTVKHTIKYENIFSIYFKTHYIVIMLKNENTLIFNTKKANRRDISKIKDIFIDYCPYAYEKKIQRLELN